MVRALGSEMPDQGPRADEGPEHGLQVYVPPYVRWRLARNVAAPGAFEESYRAVVVHADISGFTTWAEEFSARGVAGAEQVSETLNLFFERLGNIVTIHGGYTVSFAGDAVTAMWPVAAEDDLSEAARLAAQCAISVSGDINGAAGAGAGPRLRIRVAVGAGRVHAAAVGGVDGRWLPLIYGEPFAQIWKAQSHAVSGRVVLSDAAWRLIGPHGSGERLGPDAIVLSQVDLSLPRRPQAATVLPSAAGPALRSYVSRTVEAHIDARGAAWLGEFRFTTAMFVAIPDGATIENATALQRIVKPIQAIVSTFGGSINKLLAERGGVTVVAAWGLSLHAHEDDAMRAVRAAMAIEQELASLGRNASTGIATGRIFCGPMGTTEHKEYALLGDVVNVAARLAHDAGPGIRCDGGTRLEARSQIVFSAMAPAQLRGRTESVAVYAPVADKPRRPDRDVLIGRERERELLRTALDGLEGGASCGVIFVEGEPGIGKSRLVNHLIVQAQQRAVQALAGWGEPLEHSTPYHVWRDVFARLLRLDTVSDRDRQRQRVLDILDTPERKARVALTNVVLPLDFPETADSAGLPPAARARATREMLVYLFTHATRSIPVLLVLEDAHWMDSASWALAHDLANTHHALLMVVATRPVAAASMAADWRSLIEGDRCQRLRLQALTREDALALACQRLDVDTLPLDVADGVMRIAEGHPFFTEQLVLAMRDKERVIRVEAGECHVVRPLASLNFGQTVHGLVDSRIDALSPAQQQTLKVAAVLGRRFDLWSLKNTHPENPDSRDLDAQLRTLADLELLAVVDSAGGHTYQFKHAITQEAVSGWLLPTERRNLNARVARMLEEQHPADLTPVHARLAHHWREAGVVSKAVDYLELAARQALKEDANEEAIDFLEQALEHSRTTGTEADGAIALRLALWKRHSAEACWVMGDTTRAKKYVAEAMADLQTRWGTPGVVLVSQLAVCAAQAVLPRRLVVRTAADEQRRLLETSRVAALSAILHAEPVDYVGALGGGLLAHNLARRAGSTNVYALGILAYTAGMMKFHRVARTGFAQMSHEARAQNDLRPLLFGSLLKSMYLFGTGRLSDSERCLRETLDVAGRAGNQRDRARLLMLLGTLTCYSARTRDSLATLTEACQLARYDEQAALERSWSLICLGAGYAQHLPAADALERFADLRPRIMDSLTKDFATDVPRQNQQRMAATAALEALIYSRAGRHAEALTSATAALSFLDSRRNLLTLHPTTWLLVQGPLEAFVSCWEDAADRDEAQRRLIARAARRFARALSRLAWLHPVYRPRALLMQGEVTRMDGRLSQARSAWLRSLAAAQALAGTQGADGEAHFTFDRALALAALGRTTPNDDERRAQMRQARDLFVQCEVPAHQHRVESWLARAETPAARVRT